MGLQYKSKQKIMYSRNADFTNLDLFSCQDLDNYCSSPDFNKPVFTTGVPSNGYTSLNDGDDFFYQKSTQNLTACYQISFQKDFMKEHQAVFEKELQNFMESFRIYSNKLGGFQEIEKQILSKPSEKNMSCVEFISANRLSFSHEQTQNFVKKFNSFDKLPEFLNFVVSNCPKAISSELIHLTKQLLDKYESVKIELPSETELLKYASEIALAFEFVELINLKGISLNKCKESTDLIERSGKFIQVYCATTMLVIAQYFQNPYSIQEKGCFKRQLSFQCSEDQQQEIKLSSVAVKKRKYQFQF